MESAAKKRKAVDEIKKMEKGKVTIQVGTRELTPIDANLNQPLRLRGSFTNALRAHWRSFACDLASVLRHPLSVLRTPHSPPITDYGSLITSELPSPLCDLGDVCG